MPVSSRAGGLYSIKDMTDNTFTDDIRQAVDTLRRGGLILYPTDTIWGIGCDATNAEAVAKVYALKQRSESKSLITLFDCVQRTAQYVDDLPSVAEDMLELATKPLTLILDGAKNVAQNLPAEDGTLAIRITQEEFSRELCARFKKPIVSTSANISGQPSPATFGEISDEIIGGVDYVVKYRQDDLTKHSPSSIVRLGKGGLVKIIRE